MKPVKICIVTDAWHPQINGVVTTLTQTSNTLKGWGHQVKMITPELFRTIPCPTYPEIRLSITAPGTIRSMLKEFAPNAVHIATEGPLGWAARSGCRSLGIRFTTSYHTKFPEYIRLRAPVPLSWSYAMVKRFHHAAVRTMVAPTLIDELREKGFKNLVTWSRGVDTTLFRPRSKEFLDIPRPVFIYVGRVAVEKNLPAFLDLDLPGSKVVVGDGPDLAHLKQSYPKVYFMGAKRGEELAKHIAAADVFVFPSLTDTFGVVLIEAMACGIPVAAFPVTGPSYVVKHGVTGFIENDLKAAALKALDLDPAACRAHASKFSWDACTRQFASNLALQDARITNQEIVPQTAAGMRATA